MPVMKYLENKPEIDPSAYISPRASIIGRVKIGKNVGIYEYASIRADFNDITIDDNSNIQDNCTLHPTPFNPVIVGKNVVIGHNSVLHACTVADTVLIGMGSVILTGAVIGENCIIGAQSLVKEGQKIPPNSIAVGTPAKVVKVADDDTRDMILANVEIYVELSQNYRESQEK
ncbi:MAG: gamma carbonic anhydrase family protein [Candidatus Hodarchaeales archaeon]